MMKTDNVFELNDCYHDINLNDEKDSTMTVDNKQAFLTGMISTIKEKSVDERDSGIGTYSTKDEMEKAGARGKWSNQFEFFLSCLAYAVGIGNVWRFPYKCYKNGGGVFLIPYLTMLFLAALPIFYLELALGQFSQLGPNKVFGKIAPLFRGLGYGMLCITGYVAVYYNVIISWCIFYTFAGFSSRLGWEDCDNWYNTVDCYTPEFDASCTGKFLGGSTWWNNSCVPVDQYCQMHAHLDGYNHTHCIQENEDELVSLTSLHSRISPAEEFFKGNMLMMEEDTSLDNMGSFNWNLVGCLLLSWLLVMICLIKGVKSAGKVVWFTALFPYAVLVILLVRGVTLPGAVNGIYFFLTPDWSKLMEVDVWTDAATQIFYSLGPAFGGLITLASYNQRDANCQRDAVVIALANSATSIFAGFVIFSILGFMAEELGVEVSDVVEGGTALAFVAYPTAITKLPVSPLWSFLFFTMLLTLGLDSQFTMVESLITAIYDELPSLRNHKVLVVGGVCTVGFLLGLPICLQGGFYLFVLLDWYSGAWSLIFLAVLEIVLIAWVYGADSFCRDIETMGIHHNSVAKHYWTVCWKFTSPFLLSCVLVSTLVNYQPAREGDYVFPLWANVLGWCIAFSSVIILIPFGVYEILKVRKYKWPLRNLIQCDFVWRTQTRTLNALASNGDISYTSTHKDLTNLSTEEVTDNKYMSQLGQTF